MAKIDTKKQLSIQVSDGVLVPEDNPKSLFSAWKISITGAIGLLIFLPLWKPDPYEETLFFISDGILVTFEVTIVSIVFALLIGLIIGLGRISRFTLINKFSTIYIDVVRGIPLLVQIYYIYFALGALFKPLFIIQPFPCAVTAIAICYGAYIGEIVRAGIQSIAKGQMEAALALGLSRTQALFKIILPQTVKVVLPPIGNEFIALLKDSSLVSIIAVNDLLLRGDQISTQKFTQFETYTLIAIIYLIFTLFFSKLVAIMEERLKKGG